MLTKFLNKGIRRKAKGALLYVACLIMAMMGLASLMTLLSDLLVDAIPWLNIRFLTSLPSHSPKEAGIWVALWGSVWVVGLMILFALPIGVGAAIYLEEYTRKGKLASFIEFIIANLAGVPSIVYGILGLGLFVELMRLGRSIIAGALTLALLVLPLIIISSREAIRAVPRIYREGAYALGATKWQVVRGIVLPTAMPGILTGAILATSRAIGEAAPMIAIAALVFTWSVPLSPFDRFTVMPIQIYNWITMPRPEFHGLAAAGIIVLLAILLSMNSIALIARAKYQKRIREA